MTTRLKHRTPGERPGVSLRFRLALWTIGTFVCVIVALTFVSVYEERRQVTTSEHSLAWALLDHLAGMIDVTGDPSAARQHLDSICRALQAAGMDVQVAPSDSLRDGPPPVAIRPFRLGKDDFTLRYIASPGRLEAATRRSVLMHLSVGMAALVPLVVGILLVLRLHLTKPLDRITHQLNRMRDGGGWLAGSIARPDAELDGLVASVRTLGPGLGKQIEEWVVVERRASAALALRRMRMVAEQHMESLRRDASGLLDDVLLKPEASRRARALLLTLEHMRDAIDEAEGIEYAFAADNTRTST